MAGKRKNEQLRRARLCKRISQEDLAALLHISTITYARLELGAHEPSLQQLRALCTYFDCPPEQLGYMVYQPPPAHSEAL